MWKFLLLILILPFAAHAEDAPSGLPVPRFASLKSDTVNIRTGPGTRYPIAWVYRRDGLPVEIVDEFDHWRKIRDSEGTAGWVNKMMLSGDRTALVLGRSPRTLRAAPISDADPVLKAEPGVIAKLLECRKDWCRLGVEGHKGWLAKVQLWGAYPAEVFH